MQKKFKILLRIIVILIVLMLIILVAMQFKPDVKKSNYKEIDKIDNYNYLLEDRDSKLMQEVFNNLKNVLKSTEINYELYAEYLSELFVIDLFTMDNKDNKYDVGGAEYVLPEVVENYKLNVEDTIYKYMQDKNTTKRDKYAIVKSINKDTLEQTKYTFNNTEYDAYKITLNWDYEEVNEYAKKGVITLIKKDNKLYIVSYEKVE